MAHLHEALDLIDLGSVSLIKSNLVWSFSTRILGFNDLIFQLIFHLLSVELTLTRTYSLNSIKLNQLFISRSTLKRSQTVEQMLGLKRMEKKNKRSNLSKVLQLNWSIKAKTKEREREVHVTDVDRAILAMRKDF